MYATSFNLQNVFQFQLIYSHRRQHRQPNMAALVSGNSTSTDAASTANTSPKARRCRRLRTNPANTATAYETWRPVLCKSVLYTSTAAHPSTTKTSAVQSDTLVVIVFCFYISQLFQNFNRNRITNLESRLRS